VRCDSLLDASSEYRLDMTQKQQRFVDEYLIDLNATQAAIRAGYSAKTAQEQSSRLLSNVMVQGAIAEGKVKAAAKAEITTEIVIAGLFAEASDHGEGSSHSARVSAWGHLGKYVIGEKLTLAGDKANPVRVDVNVLNHPDFLDFIRDRALRKAGNAGAVRNGGQHGALENGATPGSPRPGTNGHAH